MLLTGLRPVFLTGLRGAIRLRIVLSLRAPTTRLVLMARRAGIWRLTAHINLCEFAPINRYPEIPRVPSELRPRNANLK
jgi:hypothetical protein